MAVKWSGLHHIVLGRIAEMYATIEFLKRGFEIYTTEADNVGVDLLAIDNEKNTYMIQVKACRDDNYQFVKEKNFYNKDNYFVFYIRFVDGENPFMYLIPSSAWRGDNKAFVYRSYDDKKSEAEYGINYSSNTKDLFERYSIDNFFIEDYNKNKKQQMGRLCFEVKQEDYNKNLNEFICINGNAVLDGYYCSKELLLMGIIPYIIKDEKIIWNIPISEISVADFINTFPECNENGIYAYLAPMAGGPGRILVSKAIKLTKTILGQLNPGLGISLEACNILIETYDELQDYYEEKGITPKQQLDALISSDHVSKATIMDIKNYDSYHAGRFLEALGFYWDKNIESYRINDINKARARAIIDHLDDCDI